MAIELSLNLLGHDKMCKLPTFYLYILPVFIPNDLYSTSESLSLSAIRSHLQGFQSGSAATAGILVHGRHSPISW